MSSKLFNLKLLADESRGNVTNATFNVVKYNANIINSSNVMHKKPWYNARIYRLF